MAELLVLAIDIAAQPVALVGYIVLGVWARTFRHVVGYAVAWAFVVQFFITVTGPGAGFDPVSIGIRFGLRAAGAILLTLAIFLLYKALRRDSVGGSGPSGGSGNGTAPPRKRPNHLRRVK